MARNSRRRIQFPAPGEVEVIAETVPSPDKGEVRVRTHYSAISPGTERLVYAGNVPDDLSGDASIEALQGQDLSYPISYGYACVGEVETVGKNIEEEWQGVHVFAFQPHVSRFVASPDTLIRLPKSVDLENAVMIPSLETAVNLVMDGRPMIGEAVLVFGQGVIGLLTTRLLADHSLGTLIAVDPSGPRRAHSESMGAQPVESVSELVPETGVEEKPSSDHSLLPNAERADLVYELTGQPEVLNDAVRCTGFGGRIVVGSWYGTKTAPVDLGRRFHRSRIRIVSSQVSTIDPSLQGRWTKERRMSVVLDLLSKVNPSQLISDRFEIDEAPSVYDELARDASMLQPIFVYE